MISKGETKMIKPKLKEYFRVLDANIEDKDNIYVVLGVSPSTMREITGDYALLTLLSLCDGNNTKQDILKIMKEKHNVTEKELDQVISYLYFEGILEDGEDKSAYLTEEELDRYARHFVYYSIFDNKNRYIYQEKLKKATVTLIGMGGIGNWVSLNLAAAGVGHIKGVDHDEIELSNLTRQVLFSKSDVGKLKVEKAKDKLESLNSNITFEAIPRKMTGVESVKEVIKGSDIVVLSADKPEHIHYWVDEACYDFKIPWINVGYIDSWGVCGPLVIPDKTSCLICDMKTRDVKEDTLLKTPEILSINKRAHAPSFGPLNGLVSCFAALEIIKYLTFYEKPVTEGKRWIINSANMETEIIEYPKDPGCIQCGINK
jgi:molybdopterin-synthase adenylyltransferase